MLLVAGWAGYLAPAPLCHGAEAPIDVVYCLDVTKPSRNWDTAGARGAAVWFADALLPPDARRSVLVFSFRSRDLAPHSDVPLVLRPPDPNPETSFEYALDQPAAGTPASPIWPLRRALDILAQRSGRTQAIFLFLGHRVQIGPADQLTPRIADIAGEIIGRCRLQGVRLFIVHREDQPEMDRLWTELAGSTGGAARFAQTHDDMVRAAMEWSAAISGLQTVTLGSDRLIAPPAPNRQYAVLFLSEGETLDAAQATLKNARFSISRPEDILLRGRFGLARVIPENDTARLPYDPDRILQVYGGLNRRVSAIVAPPLIADVSLQAPILARLLLQGDAGPDDGLPSSLAPNGIGLLRPLNRPDREAIAVPLVIGADPVTRAAACQATFDTPLAPGPYRLSIGDDPRQGPAESYQSDLYVFPGFLAVRPMLHRAGAGDNALVLRATLPGGPYDDTRFFVSVQKNGGPVTLVDAPAGQLVSESSIATDYAIGDRYLIATGALAFHAEGPRYVPGPISEFPPRSYLFPDPLGTRQMADAVTSPPVEADLDPTPVRGHEPLPTALALALARAEATETPTSPTLAPAALDGEAPAARFTLSPAARRRLHFFLGNLAFFIVMTLLYMLARKMGLFLGRGDRALSIPQYDDTITIHEGPEWPDGPEEPGDLSTEYAEEEAGDGLDELMQDHMRSDGNTASEDLIILQQEATDLEALAQEGELFSPTTPLVSEEESPPPAGDAPPDAVTSDLDETFTDEDLEATLKAEQFAREDRSKPQFKDLKDQRSIPTEAEESAPAPDRDEGGDEGFLSQADLDALLSGGAFSGGDDYERDEDGDLKF